MIFSYSFLSQSVLAHVSDAPHEEEGADVAAVDPIYLGGAALGVLIIGFLVWKFISRRPPDGGVGTPTA